MSRAQVATAVRLWRSLDGPVPVLVRDRCGSGDVATGARAAGAVTRAGTARKVPARRWWLAGLFAAAAVVLLLLGWMVGADPCAGRVVPGVLAGLAVVEAAAAAAQIAGGWAARVGMVVGAVAGALLALPMLLTVLLVVFLPERAVRWLGVVMVAVMVVLVVVGWGAPAGGGAC